MNLLIIASPVEAIGNGNAGGVDVTLSNIIETLAKSGFIISVLAPKDSILPSHQAQLITIDGGLQTSAQLIDRNSKTAFHQDNVLVQMCSFARERQHDFDLILNMAYDWLPIWLSPFFETPIFHLVSMSNENEDVAKALVDLNKTHPEKMAFHSQCSADTYHLKNPVTIVGNGFDIDQFPFVEIPKKQLAWVGRISPEKGLENAIEIAQNLHMPLHIWGKIQESEYKNELVKNFPNAELTWRGFKAHQQLLIELAESQVLLMTPNWIEAFGNNVVEAIGCGVPVVAYKRGGPSEIIDEGISGYLVEYKDNDQFVQQVIEAKKLSRINCRNQANKKYNLHSYGERLKTWLS